MEILNKKEATIEHFENVINNNKYDMLFLTILYNMSCYDTYEKITNKEKYDFMSFIYNFYIHDENNLSIECICEAVMSNINNMQNKKINRYNLYEYINY